MKTITNVDPDILLEMILGQINDVDDDTLVATANVVLGPTVPAPSDGDGDELYTVTFAPFAPVPIETLFTAFQTFLNDSRRAAPNVREMAVARDTFKTAIGPLAALIDWTDRS